MRYLSLVVRLLPVFLLFLVCGAAGLSVEWLAAAFVASTGTGIAVGGYANRKMTRMLFHGETHFLFTRVPGGFWFFVVFGVLIGAIIGAILVVDENIGWFVLCMGGVVLGAFFCAFLVVISWMVRRLERIQGKHVCLGPAGVYFASKQ